jgi:hypothetical protein
LGPILKEPLQMNKIMFVCLLLLFLMGCKNNLDIKSYNHIATIPIDSLFDNTSDSGLITVEFHLDTLKMVSTSPTTYYPFGKFSSIKELLDRYPFLKVETEGRFPYKDSTMLQDTLYILSSNGNQLKLLLEPELKIVQIVSGKIINREISQINDVSVGMSIIDFIHTYFSRLPEGYEKINVIEIESALSGIWHYYNFNQDTLSKIIYISDYQYN